MWKVVLVFFVILGGLWLGKIQVKKEEIQIPFPLVERKSFVIALYAHNQAEWCERALRSIFSQDYEHYRVILMDDASTDSTAEIAKEFIIQNQQSEKVLLMRNESVTGKVASLYQTIDHCLDREIVIPLDAKDWLASETALEKINQAYQNPDVWMVESPLLEYPSYEREKATQISFYAALFKQIKLEDLREGVQFKMHPIAYLAPLKKMGEGRSFHLEEPTTFHNQARQSPAEPFPKGSVNYKPLAEFPKPLQGSTSATWVK